MGNGKNSRDNIGNTTGCSAQGTYCTKPNRDLLDRVHSDQEVLEVIRRGRLIFVIGDQES
jgi:hypothetical protein